jgi:hypothetical protein
VLGATNGLGRHEILNETNQDQVHADMLAWPEGLASRGREQAQDT